jgi:hypothetical protein
MQFTPLKRSSCAEFKAYLIKHLIETQDMNCKCDVQWSAAINRKNLRTDEKPFNHLSPTLRVFPTYFNTQ